MRWRRSLPFDDWCCPMLLLLTVSVAAVVGWLARKVRLPGGTLVGAMIGAAAVTLMTGAELVLPLAFRILAFGAVGLITGILVTRDRVRQLLPFAKMAVGSAAVLIVAGGLLTWMLRALGIAPPAVALATSPGALSVLASIAVEHGDGAVEVALFHVVRVVLVILLLPVILMVRPDVT